MPTQNIFDLVDTWASGGGPYTSIKMNATDNDSGSASLLMDLQVGAASQASIDKRGTFSFAAPASGTAPSRPGIGNWFGTLGLFGNSGTLAATVSSTSINFGTSYQLAWNTDVILTRRAAANLRLGAADAATAQPQILSVQSVVAGTSNTAGANLTITGSQGTGNAAGGSIIFQVAPLGSSGSAQNALATALTIGSDRTTTLTGALTFLVSGGDTSTHTITTNSGGYITFARAADVGLALYEPGGYVQTRSDGHFGWTASSSPATTVDLKLSRDAANTLALRNGTAAQRFNVYNTWTSSTNYEAFKIDWITTANTVLVGTEKGSGGGTARALEFQTDGTTRLTIASTGLVTVNGGNLVLGETGVLRTRYINNGNNSLSMFDFVADATGTATFAVGGSAPLMRFGGTSASFPAIKRSTTFLQARLADDSAFASVQGKLTTDTAYTAGAPTATGYLVVYDSAGTAYKIPAVAV